MSVEAAPWADKEFAYAGWVPNVHSHLSFSLIGKGRGTDVTSWTQKYQHAFRAFACVLQRRETDDFLSWMWLSRIFRPQVIQHFLLIGSSVAVEIPIGVIDVTVEAPQKASLVATFRSLFFGGTTSVLAHTEGAERRITVERALDEQGMLRGRILVLPRQKARKDRKRQKAWIAQLRARLNRDEDFADVETASFAESVTLEAQQHNKGAVIVEFALFRSGEVRVWFDDPEGRKLKQNARQEISRQCYYFMKDMVHHHVHHDPKSDQITPLTEIGGQTPNQAEEHWRRDTVWSLSRAIDGLARGGTLQQLREATGIIAYADAFQSTLMQYRRQADKPAEFEPNPVTYNYDFKHIRESLRVQIEQASARRTLRAQMFVAAFAACVAATSLVVSAVSAYNGALKAKIIGTPMVLGFATDDLRLFAYYWFTPTMLVVLGFLVLSWLTLAEDRIRQKRAPSYKLAQAARGIANSIALAMNRGSKTAGRLLQLFYLVAFAGLGAVARNAPNIARLLNAAIPSVPTPVIAQSDPTPSIAVVIAPVLSTAPLRSQPSLPKVRQHATRGHQKSRRHLTVIKKHGA